MNMQWSVLGAFSIETRGDVAELTHNGQPTGVQCPVAAVDVLVRLTGAANALELIVATLDREMKENDGRFPAELSTALASSIDTVGRIGFKGITRSEK